MAARSVLHVIPSVAARYGGPSAAVVGMCRAIRETGGDVLIATTDADGPNRLDVELGTVTAFEGIPTIFFRRQATEALKWSAPLGSWVRRHAADYDVVHAHAIFSHAPLAAARACRAAGVPYIIRPLGTLDPWSVERKAWRKRALLRLSARDALTGAAAIHYTTREEQRLAEEGLAGLPRGVVIPLGIDDRYYAATPAPVSPAYALVLSRLDGKKRIEWVINAWHRFDGDTERSWRLVIAGDGDPGYVERLRQRAAAGPAADRIVFKGWVGGDAKLDLLRHAAVFVVSSHQENFGVAMVEAMAAGVAPVVTPGVNLATDLETAGAGWRADETPDAFAAVLRHVMHDEAGRRDRGRRARAFAEQFRWPTIGRQLGDLYDGLARSRADRRGAGQDPEAASSVV
jgi:glycosyltransferase involved in cell wall biosynthesis